MLLLRLDGPLHHFASAAGVEREHANRQLRGGLHRLRDGVGNIVELEVEKDIEAQVGDFAHGVGTTGGVHFEADLDPTNGALELAESRNDVAGRLSVENKNQITRHFRPTKAEEAARMKAKLPGKRIGMGEITVGARWGRRASIFLVMSYLKKQLLLSGRVQ